MGRFLSIVVICGISCWAGAAGYLAAQEVAPNAQEEEAVSEDAFVLPGIVDGGAKTGQAFMQRALFLPVCHDGDG